MRTSQAAQEQRQPPRLRSRSRTAQPSKKKSQSASVTLPLMTNVIPAPQPPKQRSGRIPERLSEQADSEIRYQFQLLLSEKIYPTTANLLERLHAAHRDFPIQSQTTLRRHLHRIGFSYKSTTKVKIPLDHVSFVAQRAKFYRKIDELRTADALIFYHDESWLNVGEEKKSIWVDDVDRGRIRKSDGSRIAISAMMNIDGFHLPSIDVFSCSKYHSVNAEYFFNWIEKAAFRLREDNGPRRRICIVVDNAPWHCELENDSKPAGRSWTKAAIKKWLRGHNVPFDELCSKAELLELALANRPVKRYKIDQVAIQYNVEIIRLPIKHCCLNPIELCWANLKDYVRKNNTHFRITDVHQLAAEFIAGYDGDASAKAIEHARKIENQFRVADRFVEEYVEPNLIDHISDDELDVSSEDDDSNN
ncbi:unnamed protein product [Rotaria sordida]|uniref:Tc1-like transposase DDE domain-containing protein n=2 Tax=Rotaria sordida TaxID=392033 RepID=A0A820B8D5_9BILA|nr:unnamed protein product [Rotaria sordida]